MSLSLARASAEVNARAGRGPALTRRPTCVKSNEAKAVPGASSVGECSDGI